MPSFVTVTSGATAQAQDVNQLINALNGTAGQGIPISLTALNDSVNFALALKNADPTNSRALQVLRSNNNVLIQADASGVIVSPDGGATTGQVLTVNATQTLTNKTLTSPTISGTVVGGAIYTAPHMTSPVVDSGNLQVTGASGAAKLYMPNGSTNGGIASIDYGTVANGTAINVFTGFTTPTGNGFNGLLIVSPRGGTGCGLFWLNGGANTVTVIASGGGNTYGVASLAAQVNVFWNGSTAYILQNNSGSGQLFSATWLPVVTNV